MATEDLTTDRNFGLQPVEVEKEYDVELTEMNHHGDDIAKVQGFIIFVKGGQTERSR